MKKEKDLINRCFIESGTTPQDKITKPNCFGSRESGYNLYYLRLRKIYDTTWYLWILVHDLGSKIGQSFSKIENFLFRTINYNNFL